MSGPRDAVVGAAMRIYRRSPLYPAWGKRFARVLAKTQGDRGPVVKEIDGITYELDLGETIDSSLYYSGTFEASTEKALEILSKPGRVALDIGANVGYHTFRVARGVGAEGRVIALEPMSRARQRLERNLALNPQITNVEILPVAVSDENATRRLSFQSSYPLAGNSEIVTEQIRLVTLDDLVAELDLPRVDLIKLDVDGFEGKVFRGARETLVRHRPDLVFEISPGAMRVNGDDPDELFDLLEGLGYEIRHEDATPVMSREVLFSTVGDYSINLVAMVD